MNNDLLIYKSAFQITLLPIFELLEFKRTQLSQEDWVRFVEMTKRSIITNPEQFLGREFPGSLLTEQIVEEIFFEFTAENEVSV
jgi:hypothetical protein